jgi:hypothetical protein
MATRQSKQSLRRETYSLKKLYQFVRRNLYRNSASLYDLYENPTSATGILPGSTETPPLPLHRWTTLSFSKGEQKIQIPHQEEPIFSRNDEIRELHGKPRQSLRKTATVFVGNRVSLCGN